MRPHTAARHALALLAACGGLALVDCSGTQPQPPVASPAVAPAPVRERRPRPAQAQFQRRVALVIGNARYASVAQLVNPENDARAVGALLREIGFDDVQVGTNLTHGELLGRVEGFARGLRPGDLALVYYAGHGVSVGGNNYLLPTDFSLDYANDLPRHLASRAFAVEQLLQGVDGRATVNVLVFDACRNNPWAERARSLARDATTARSIGRGLQAITAPRGSLVAFSTAPGQIADDGTGAHSVFTTAFLRRAREGVDLLNMLTAVTGDVEDVTSRAQTPWQQSSLRGRVYLASRTEEDGGEAQEEAPAAVATSACPEGMVEVPAGSFLMGSPEGQGNGDEHPQHRVHLRAYCIDRTEVTVRAYRACVEAGRCRAETTTNWAGSEDAFWSRFCNWSKPDRDEHPINCVDWSNANAYCEWRGGRLPTEAEWEYAARGSDGRAYPWGNEAPGPTRLNAYGGEARRYMESLGRTGWNVMYDGDDGWPTTAPVGSYPIGASPFGALDMAGNAWEWVGDWHGPYLAGEASNPTGPVDGTLRVLRGGGWNNGDPSWVRAPSRSGSRRRTATTTSGFAARGGHVEILSTVSPFTVVRGLIRRPSVESSSKAREARPILSPPRSCLRGKNIYARSDRDVEELRARRLPPGGAVAASAKDPAGDRTPRRRARWGRDRRARPQAPRSAPGWGKEI